MSYKTKKPITTLAILSGIALFSVLGFIFGNVRDSIFGAPLSINSITNGTTLSDGFLPIIGNARHAKSVTINGRAIAIDRQGNFTDGVLLSPGYNVVEVALRDQFGKQKTRTYHLVLSDSDSIASVRKRSDTF